MAPFHRSFYSIADIDVRCVELTPRFMQSLSHFENFSLPILHFHVIYTSRFRLSKRAPGVVTLCQSEWRSNGMWVILCNILSCATFYAFKKTPESNCDCRRPKCAAFTVCFCLRPAEKETTHIHQQHSLDFNGSFFF